MNEKSKNHNTVYVRDSNTSNTRKEEFHDKHEDFTEIAYNRSGLLPHRYVFILTNLCNLRCSFCFQRRNRRKDSMTAEDWIRLAEQLPPYARVTMTGGEPFVFPGFEPVFSYVAERFECNIISNGVLLTEGRIELILSYPKFRVLSISIDNVKNTLRGVKEKQWMRTEQMMQYFIERRNEVHPDCVLDVKTMVLDENAEGLLKVRKYCVEELGCDTHSFMFLKGSPIQHADYMFGFDDILKKSHAPVYKRFDTIKQQLELVRQYNLQMGKGAFVHPKVCSLSSETPLPNIDYLNEAQHIKENYLPCKYPWSSVHINADGSLFPCLAVSMGNVKEMALSDIVNGKEFTRFTDLIRKEGTVEGCNRCGWLRSVAA